MQDAASLESRIMTDEEGPVIDETAAWVSSNCSHEERLDSLAVPRDLGNLR